ncbi:MAG: response regulator [Lachnospiraceae bacterium]|nr:response regulator [Lachnospiraceae bacterium]MBD5504317.1 response regulator [Lachnospiraceae bacterium]
MNIMVTVHGVGIIICFIMIMLIYVAKPSEQQKILFAGTLFTFMDVAGYFFELQSKSLEVTRLAVKMEYIGTTMGLLSFLYFACLYSNHKNDKSIRIIKGFYTVNHIWVLSLVFTIDYHTLYYKSITYSVNDDGYYLWIYEPGIFYYWWAATTAVLGCVIALIMIQSVLEHKGEKRPELLLIFGASLLPIGFWILRLMGMVGYYDTYPISMMITESLLVLVMYHYRLFDTVQSAKDRVVDEIREGILVVDELGKIVYFNHEAELIFPKINWNDKSEVSEHVLQFMEAQNDGFMLRGRFYKWQRSEIDDDNRRKVGILYRISDMTDNYLYTKQLIELKEEAERANEAKSSFLARMSHEIRTPINAVLGMNEMILRETQSDNIMEYASNINSAGRTLLSIINDILDLSKIESSRMEIVENNYNLGRLLIDVENMISMRAEEKNLYFRVVTDDKLPNQLHGDDIRIKQCMTNLLTNSVKYTKEGNVTLKVDFTSNDGDMIDLRITVSDTGIGIKEEELHKLFDPFTRLDLLQNKSVEGTGLGLSITKRLVEMMGGELTVDSCYGKGSSFSFVIPQKSVGSELLGDYKTNAIQMSEIKTRERKEYIAPKARILAVDDNRVNLTVVKGLLKKLKVQFDSAGSGQECLAKVRQNHYDIILLDHMMPDMDGIETLRAMQQIEEYIKNRSVVIALTANAIVGAKEEYLSEGFEDYLSKPIDFVMLEEMIRKYLPEDMIEYVS